MSGKDYESNLHSRPRPSQGKTIGIIFLGLLVGILLLIVLINK